ncbi:UNVERIFIED_CONTAM: hypothetical protein K2H54_004132 [Gekko kuhli]
MLQSDASNPRMTKDYVMRRFLEGVSVADPEHKGDIYHLCEDEEVYHTVEQNNFPSELVNRPPVPVPRPDPTKQQDKEPYIHKGHIAACTAGGLRGCHRWLGLFPASSPHCPASSRTPVFSGKDPEKIGNLYVSSENLRKESAARCLRVHSQPSIYDPFAGMKTPGQRQLITLQEQVKLGMLTVDEAVLHFREWQLNQKKRSDSFRFQQDNLKRLRDSITRRQLEKQKAGKHSGKSL